MAEDFLLGEISSGEARCHHKKRDSIPFPLLVAKFLSVVKEKKADIVGLVSQRGFFSQGHTQCRLATIDEPSECAYWYWRPVQP